LFSTLIQAGGSSKKIASGRVSGISSHSAALKTIPQL
jgi:hypothetical protein